jgi:hypothetical protein
MHVLEYSRGLMPLMENLTSLLVLFKNILIWLPENKKGRF